MHAAASGTPSGSTSTCSARTVANDTYSKQNQGSLGACALTLHRAFPSVRIVLLQVNLTCFNTRCSTQQSTRAAWHHPTVLRIANRSHPQLKA